MFLTRCRTRVNLCACLARRQVKKVCAQVLAALFECDAEGVFGAPVDGVAGYNELIRKPMDLSTMAAKNYPTVTKAK